MGCAKSTEANEGQAGGSRIRPPRPWRHNDRRLSWAELQEMRSTFWQNAPRYSGRRVIWDALKDAAECGDLNYTQRILDIHRINYPNGDMTLCVDDRGVNYELPLYVLSEPTNLENGRSMMGRLLHRR